jgi:integrase/recombinase XerD
MAQRILEAFINHLRTEQLHERTIGIYAYIARSYLDALAIHGHTLADATRDSVGRYLLYQQGRGCKQGSLKNMQTVIRRLHEFAREPEANPLERRFHFKRPALIPKSLPEDWMKRLIESVTGADPMSLRDRAMLEVLYATGIRSVELLGMEWDDPRLAKGSARIMGAKGGGEAVVSWGEHAQGAVDRYLKHGRPELQGRDPCAALWLNCFGGPLKYGGLYRATQMRAREAGLPPVRPHMLRHSFATHLMEHGAPMPVIQELMRHRSLSSTEVYTKVDGKRLATERKKYHPRG